MPRCMKTGGTCTLHKNSKNAQLGHTAGGKGKGKGKRGFV